MSTFLIETFVCFDCDDVLCCRGNDDDFVTLSATFKCRGELEHKISVDDV